MFRIFVDNEFQWHDTFWSYADAAAQADDAQAEFPDSTVVVQKLETISDEESRWEEAQDPQATDDDE